MSKSNRLLRGNISFTLTVNSTEVELGKRLLRIFEGDSLVFRLELPENDLKIKKIVLHSNMINGRWQCLSFRAASDLGVYELNLKAERCGRSAFRFFVITDDNRLWEAADYHQILIDPAAMDGLCLYTLIPKAAGPISEWTEKLTDIAAMGFNAVHILPFTRLGASGSPYSAADLFSIDASYGGNRDEFSSFCAAAAKLGIMICLDIVLNHIGCDNVICREHAEWIIPDGERPDGMKRAGCYHNNDWISWEDLVLLNYDHPDPEIRMQIYNYMLSYVLFWLDAAGKRSMIRLDNLHSSNERFIRWLIPEIRKVHPGIIILSEYFGAEYHLDEAVVNYGLNLITANSWEFPFAPILEKYIAGLHSPASTGRYLLTPVSHDTESAAKLFGKADSSVPRYAVCGLMGTGIAGIVQGFESGVPSKLEFIGKDRTIIPETGIDYSRFISAVNSLVKNERCLRQKGNIEFYDTGNDSLIVCRRRSPEGGGILIAVNLDIHHGHSFNYHLIGESEILLSEKAEAVHNVNDDIIYVNLQACGSCAIRTIR